METTQSATVEDGVQQTAEEEDSGEVGPITDFKVVIMYMSSCAGIVG